MLSSCLANLGVIFDGNSIFETFKSEAESNLNFTCFLIWDELGDFLRMDFGLEGDMEDDIATSPVTRFFDVFYQVHL